MNKELTNWVIFLKRCQREESAPAGSLLRFVCGVKCLRSHTLETVAPHEGNIPNCESKEELDHLDGAQTHWPCLALKHVLTTADPLSVPRLGLSVSE